MGAAGAAIALLYPDSYQQDGGYHYLFARVAWQHPEIFVGVWTRPLFTFLYAFPAQWGYPAAKMFTVLICVITAYHTVRAAERTGQPGAALAAPLLFLQPAYLQLSADTMTEPIFALVFIIAIRLHLAGHIVWGAVTASLMILARPEGLFLGVLWAVWLAFDRREPQTRRLLAIPFLGLGAATWWLVALILTGDPLFIRNNWPPDWGLLEAAYGTGPLWVYARQLPEIAGPLLCLFLVFGLAVLAARRQMGLVAASFLTIFVTHSVLRAFGFFGAAGYPRYFVCVAPAMALITLAGWNEAARRLTRAPRLVAHGAAAGILAVSALFAVFYVDGAIYTRDAHAVTEMYDWFQANERPVRRLIWSQAYMCILLDCDVWEKPAFSQDKEANLEIFRQAPGGTLVFWDGETGPSWYSITDEDLEAAGYLRLRSKSYTLGSRFKLPWWRPAWETRTQEMHLFYKPV